MADQAKTPKVLLDVNFLLGQNAARALDVLRKAGCVIVLVDQLVYELCTSSTGAGAWAAVQPKLMDFADHVEVWTHSGELLRSESQTQRPVPTPVDAGLTAAVRAWLRSRQAYVPPDLATLTAAAHSQRERDSVDAAVRECRKLARQRPDLGATLRRKNSRRESLDDVAQPFVNDSVQINALMAGFLNRPTGPSRAGPAPATHLDPGWFAFHHARSFLALACVYLLNYEGRLDEKVKDATYASFVNTVLDSDYAALLTYADAIATNETKDLFKMCRWMHGDAKCIVTTKDLLDAEVPWGNIAEAAYHLWAKEQYGDGDDQGDWFRAESALYREAWDRLCAEGGGHRGRRQVVRGHARSKLMYTPHPDRNAIGATMPEDLVDAVRHRHEIDYGVLREMREIVWALADLTVSLRPDLVPFFATGGIPYVFPVMHVLSDRRERALTDGTRFHMFPGLAWGGKLEGRTTLAYFVEEFGRLVNESLTANGRATVLEIDTTNTGNSTKRFVRAMYELCSRHSIVRPADLAVHVVAVVNRKRAADGTHEEGTFPVQTSTGGVPVLIPEGFRATGPLVDRQPTEFVREDGQDRFRLTVSYWIAEDIPTEDRADLLGVHAQHDLLGVRGGVTPGRLVIRFPARPSNEDTGGNTPGHRLINMLASPLSSEPWRTHEQYANMPPLTPEQEQFVAESKVWSEAPLRLTELDSGDPERATDALVAINRLLTGAEIYWLSRREHIPENLLARVTAKVLATLRADPAADGNVETIRADEATPPSPDSIEPHTTLAPEAVAFFRRFRPDLASGEPDGDWPAKARWWLDRLKKR